MKKIAICTGNSPLGIETIQHIRSLECEVICLSQSDINGAPLELTKKIDGCDVVCNMIGVPYVAKWSDKYIHDMYCSRMLGIRALATAFKYCKNMPTTFIHISNAMVYDQYEVHDEYSNIYSNSFLAEVGLMETKEILNIAKEYHEIRLTIVRCGYLMCKNGGLFPVLKKVFHSGIGGYIGDGYQCLPMIHIKDAVRALTFIIEDDRCNGIINLTIPEMASLMELSNAFARQTSRPRIPIPDFLIKMFVGRSISLLEQNCKVEPSRLTAMGFEYKYPNVNAIVDDLYNS